MEHAVSAPKDFVQRSVIHCGWAVTAGERLPSGAKVLVDSAAFAARLKSCPFKTPGIAFASWPVKTPGVAFASCSFETPGVPFASLALAILRSTAFAMPAAD